MAHRSSFVLSALGVAFAVLAPVAAAAEEIPADFRGSWKVECQAETASLDIATDSVTVTSDGKSVEFDDIMVSHTYYGGAKADGSHVWLLAGRGGTTELVIEMPGYGMSGPITIEDYEADGVDLSGIFDVEFTRCS